MGGISARLARSTYGFNAQMRIVQTVSSMDARVGDPLQGVLTQPLFTSDHHLILPQGTRLNGRITLTSTRECFAGAGSFASL